MESETKIDIPFEIASTGTQEDIVQYIRASLIYEEIIRYYALRVLQHSEELLFDQQTSSSSLQLDFGMMLLLDQNFPESQAFFYQWKTLEETGYDIEQVLKKTAIQQVLTQTVSGQALDKKLILQQVCLFWIQWMNEFVDAKIGMIITMITLETQATSLSPQDEKYQKEHNETYENSKREPWFPRAQKVVGYLTGSLGPTGSSAGLELSSSSAISYQIRTFAKQFLNKAGELKVPTTPAKLPIHSGQFSDDFNSCHLQEYVIRKQIQHRGSIINVFVSSQPLNASNHHVSLIDMANSDTREMDIFLLSNVSLREFVEPLFLINSKKTESSYLADPSKTLSIPILKALWSSHHIGIFAQREANEPGCMIVWNSDLFEYHESHIFVESDLPCTIFHLDLQRRFDAEKENFSFIVWRSSTLSSDPSSTTTLRQEREMLGVVRELFPNSVSYGLNLEDESKTARKKPGSPDSELGVLYNVHSFGRYFPTRKEGEPAPGVVFTLHKELHLPLTSPLSKEDWRIATGLGSQFWKDAAMTPMTKFPSVSENTHRTQHLQLSSSSTSTSSPKQKRKEEGNKEVPKSQPFVSALLGD